MKQWLSKFRSQRLKERYKDGVQKASDIAPSWWNAPLISWMIGLFTWAAASLLLHVGPGQKMETMAIVTLASAGNVFLLLVITLVSGILLRVVTPEILKNNTRLMLLGMCALLALIPGSVLIHLAGQWAVLSRPLAEMLVPFSLAPILAGILLGASAALVVGVWTTLACLIIGGFSIPLLMAGLIATSLSAQLTPKLRRRTQLIRVGFIIGLLQIASLAALIEHFPADSLLAGKLALACVCSGLGSALIALLMLPVCEALFGVTSNMTLLEMSDLAHPLLQRLAFEAPGTYHHSLMVANMAQAAADEIGANSILARVGAYFHDIGKVTKPGYFAENIRTGENPHDGLAPSMSALLVMAHIKEGLTLALLHKLPRPVMDIIQQHHGTGLVVYFHHKAGQQALSDPLSSTGRGRTVVDESSYRYPGPKPYSREAAIIMLADSVEAASRSLEKPTPAGISELVDRLTNSRIEDNQLDNCEMTLAELARVKRSFVFCLSNMLHTRIAYPKM